MLSQGSFQVAREAEESEPERWQHEKTWPNVADLEDGRMDHKPRNVGGKGHGQSWKGQGIDFPLEPPEHSPAVTLILAQ